MSAPRCRLYLVTAPLGLAATGTAPSALEARPVIEAALAAGDVACLLLRLSPAADRDRKEVVQLLAPAVQACGTALLLEDPRLAAYTGADGVHVSGAGQAFADAMDSLKPERIVGAGGLVSRDDAMQAGEAGVDYVMFGEAGFSSAGPPLAEVAEAVDWWAEIFNVPCVGFARTLDDVGALARAGAEFVALSDAVWTDPRGATVAVAEAEAALVCEALASEAMPQDGVAS